MELIRQIIYISTSTHSFNQNELDLLIKKANKNNKINQITGILLYSGSTFIHLLEGSSAAVSILYERIAKDGRNTGNTILLDRMVPNRAFPDENLGFRTIEQVTFEAIYSLCLTNPSDAIKKMDLMTNVKLPSCRGFDPERLLLFQKIESYHESLETTDFFEFSTELAADEVFLMKDDSQIIYVNHAACQKLGYKKEELIGKHVWEWDPLFPKDVWPSFFSDFIEKKHIHFQTQHKKKMVKSFQ